MSICQASLPQVLLERHPIDLDTVAGNPRPLGAVEFEARRGEEEVSPPHVTHEPFMETRDLLIF
jgi:hypothetical protein